jgi:hypothetical protein
VALRDVFQRAALTIRTAFDDVPVSVSYYAHASTVYDPDAGNLVVYETLASAVPVFFIDFSTAQVDGQNVLAEDRLVLIAALDLPTAYTPSVNDRLVETATGEAWAVQRVATDPADAHYQLQVRK